MNADIREKFPKWCNDSEEHFELMLTDDIDSLVSCALLKKLKGYLVNYYYDFDAIYQIKESDNRAIAVDCSLVTGKCWDNHVSMLSKVDTVNEESANLNSIFEISRDNYIQKFCGSTALQILSYYDLPLPESEEGKMALLTIDSGFLGHYSDRFRGTHTQWMNYLGFPELVELLYRHEKDEFFQIINKYNIKSKLQLNQNGVLATNLDLSSLEGLFCLDLSLPEEVFTVRKGFKRPTPVDLNQKTYTKKDLPEIFSIALTFKNTVCYTEII